MKILNSNIICLTHKEYSLDSDPLKGFAINLFHEQFCKDVYYEEKKFFQNSFDNLMKKNNNDFFYSINDFTKELITIAFEEITLDNNFAFNIRIGESFSPKCLIPITKAAEKLVVIFSGYSFYVIDKYYNNNKTATIVAILIDIDKSKLFRENREKCCHSDLIEIYEGYFASNPVNSENDDKLLEEFIEEPLSVRALNICNEAGINTLSRILNFYSMKGSFKILKNCGPKTDKELIEFCEKYLTSNPFN